MSQDRQQGGLISLIYLKNWRGDTQTDGQTETDKRTDIDGYADRHRGIHRQHSDLISFSYF
jgi:hypothetical protein